MELKNIKIEFKKNYIKEQIFTDNNINLEINKCNKLPSQNLFFSKFGYLNSNFHRKDSVGYLKIKNQENWLHENVDGFFFDKIRNGLFEKRQPAVIWFDYITEKNFVIYKHSVFGSRNKIYLNYSEKNNRIKITWSDNISDATVFSFDYYNEKDWIELLGHK